MTGIINITEADEKKEITKRLIELSEQPILMCLQCGKCTAGCPFALEMDLDPHQIVRLSQLGLLEELMESEAIYFCATCFTCGNRCPMKIDIAALSEALRLIASKEFGEKYGPDSVSEQDAKNAPQQALVSLFRKFGI